MTGEKHTKSGWVRSRELISLAKPLAVLLAVALSLSIHIDASVAAGSDSPLCLSVISIEKQDSGSTSRQVQSEHCSLCVFALNDVDAILRGSNEVFQFNTSRLNVTPVRLVHSNFSNEANGIRGPPAS